MDETSPEKHINLVSKDFIGEKEWFFLYWIEILKIKTKGIINTPDLCNILPISQQTISRRIIELEGKGLIWRTFDGKGGEIQLTTKGLTQLNMIYENLKEITSQSTTQIPYYGKLKSGMGEGAYYIKHPTYLKQIKLKLGFTPFFGTLNLELFPEISKLLNNQISNFKSVTIKGFIDDNRTFGDVNCFPVTMWPRKNPQLEIQAALLQIKRTSHKKYILEFIAQYYLREYFTISDEEEVCFKLVNL